MNVWTRGLTDAEAAFVAWRTLDTLAFTTVERACQTCRRTCYYDLGGFRWRHGGPEPADHEPCV